METKNVTPYRVVGAIFMYALTSKERREKEQSEWTLTKFMPDFDGDYLCHIVRKEDCGAFTKYQKVVNENEKLYQS